MHQLNPPLGKGTLSPLAPRVIYRSALATLIFEKWKTFLSGGYNLVCGKQRQLSFAYNKNNNKPDPPMVHLGMEESKLKTELFARSSGYSLSGGFWEKEERRVGCFCSREESLFINEQQCYREKHRRADPLDINAPLWHCTEARVSEIAALGWKGDIF